MKDFVNKLDGMPEMQEKLSGLISEYQKSLESLTNLVSVLSEEDKFGKSEIVDVNRFFKQLADSNNFTISGYQLNYQVDINSLFEAEILENEKYDVDEYKNIPLYIDIAKVDLERLVNNIFENAKKHGFVNKESDYYFIRMVLSYNSESDTFQIDFINNGDPLPEGIDKARYGLRGEKAGKTGATGNGGYIVKSITQHYKGDYDVFMDGNNTVIRVVLPISRESYE
jgi:signal transduction histidine kinase